MACCSVISIIFYCCSHHVASLGGVICYVTHVKAKIVNSLYAAPIFFREFCKALQAFASLYEFLQHLLPRDALLSAVYAVVVCLSVCVCVCVCLSHSGIVSKRLNVGSRK